MRNEFTAIIERDGEWYIAYCPEISGANGQGRTKEEARDTLAEAIALILEDRREEMKDHSRLEGALLAAAEHHRPRLAPVRRKRDPDGIACLVPELVAVPGVVHHNVNYIRSVLVSFGSF